MQDYRLDILEVTFRIIKAVPEIIDPEIGGVEHIVGEVGMAVPEATDAETYQLVGAAIRDWKAGQDDPMQVVAGPTIMVNIARRFWEDHYSRDLPSGRLVKTMKNVVKVELDQYTLDELRSDADYYADPWTDTDDVALKGSAKSVLRKLEGVEVG